jgi:non-ribosomal peptide synthetase component E (peptide arylation enzyme)
MTEGIDKRTRAIYLLTYGVPYRYLIVDGIPRTSVGEIKKIQLRKLMVRRAKNGF